MITSSLSVTSVSSVKTALSTEVSVSGQAFSFVFAEVGNSFTLASDTFSFFSTTTFQSMDFTVIEAALALEWSATYPGTNTWYALKQINVEADKQKYGLILKCVNNETIHYTLNIKLPVF